MTRDVWAERRELLEYVLKVCLTCSRRDYALSMVYVQPTHCNTTPSGLPSKPLPAPKRNQFAIMPGAHSTRREGSGGPPNRRVRNQSPRSAQHHRSFKATLPWWVGGWRNGMEEHHPAASWSESQKFLSQAHAPTHMFSLTHLPPLLLPPSISSPFPSPNPFLALPYLPACTQLGASRLSLPQLHSSCPSETLP